MRVEQSHFIITFSSQHYCTLGKMKNEERWDLGVKPQAGVPQGPRRSPGARSGPSLSEAGDWWPLSAILGSSSPSLYRLNTQRWPNSTYKLNTQHRSIRLVDFIYFFKAVVASVLWPKQVTTNNNK